ncbi:MAG: rod shape-determining protein MreC [Eubacteriales bacterium]|nr:rod shape-determining protein MreC [Eubacteriales bacterium]
MKNWWKDLTGRKWFPIAVLLVVLGLLMAFYTGMTKEESPTSKAAKGALVPAQRAVTHMAVKVANLYNRVFFFDDLLAENESLKKQVSDLKQELNDAQDALDENEELREMLGVAQRGAEFKYETAEVVARKMDEWSSVLTIDSGEKDGLELYDCVINSDGLIGYITQISDHAAEITTVLDPDLQVGAMILGTDEIGVCHGDYKQMSKGRLIISYLNLGATVGKGSTVETSGSGGLFPKGLLIGTVHSVKTASDGMSDYAVIEPYVDVKSVTRVFVITDYSISD